MPVKIPPTPSKKKSSFPLLESKEHSTILFYGCKILHLVSQLGAGQLLTHGFFCLRVQIGIFSRGSEHNAVSTTKTNKTICWWLINSSHESVTEPTEIPSDIVRHVLEPYILSVNEKTIFFAVKKTSPTSSNKLNTPFMLIRIALNFCTICIFD